MISGRHKKSCPHRDKGRHYWCQDCPIWVDFWKDDHHFQKSTKLTDTGPLEEFLIGGSGKKPDAGFSHQEKVEAQPITLAEAGEKFMAQARNRKLSPAAIYKYDLLRRRMEDFAKEHKKKNLKF